VYGRLENQRVYVRTLGNEMKVGAGEIVALNERCYWDVMTEPRSSRTKEAFRQPVSKNARCLNAVVALDRVWLMRMGRGA
jgi:hypothetical protein